ncbi:MAG: GFA family protein [Parvularculaceae bacterium]
MSAEKHSASCQCGAVRAEMSGAPRFVANCHCNSCRRATGAAFSTWVGFTDDAVRWPAGAPSFYASSKGVKRGYCGKCGTPLTYASDKWPGETHFLIGVMGDPHAYTPTGEVFAEDALAWAQHVTPFKP